MQIKVFLPISLILFVVLWVMSLPCISEDAHHATNSHRYVEIYVDEGNVHHGVLHSRGIGKYSPAAQSPAQARLMAKRAARVDAYRNLLSMVHGAQPTIRTGTVHYGGYLHGAAVVGEHQLEKQGIAEVDMVLYMEMDKHMQDVLREKGVTEKRIDEQRYRKLQKKSNYINENEWKSWQQ